MELHQEDRCCKYKRIYHSRNIISRSGNSDNNTMQSRLLSPATCLDVLWVKIVYFCLIKKHQSGEILM